ncbi:MarR family transcriptional regulator [Sphingomonas ginkgonis]|uniref:MarR family transcriptional regulator n=1 Tax=Sphingomonas ginkgonis TaxID=2315330 RepID=A0A3R9WTW6_9SPHN|nr:MarR family transcriptional regulator [Sphingomonas ginkgonis]RST31739.1 MarR family transcriptional regulator [Sphingomonas ginkgonis]
MPNETWEIVETADALRRAVARRVTAHGVTRSQWRVLARISKEPGLRQVDLAERLDMEPIVLCRIVDKLEESGFVERQRDPADRRAWRLVLTAKAAPVIEELHAVAAELAAEAFAGMTPSQIEQMRSALATVRDNVAEGGRNRKALGA